MRKGKKFFKRWWFWVFIVYIMVMAFIVVTHEKTDKTTSTSISNTAKTTAVDTKAEINHIEVTVDINGSGDYTSLRTCFSSINPTAERPYIVNILPGEYDIKSYYTPEEWAVESSAFVGLIVPDYVTLRGKGDREKIDLYVIEKSKRQYISTLNLHNTASLENLTVKGTYTRYAVHDDKATVGVDYQRKVKNCHIISENTFYNNTYGSGCKSGADWEFEDTIIDNLTSGGTAFSNHNSVEVATKGNKIKFTNCQLNATDYSLSFGSLFNNANGMETEVTINGCNGTGKLRLREENAATYGAGIVFKVKGSNSTFSSIKIVNTNGLNYTANVDIQ